MQDLTGAETSRGALPEKPRVEWLDGVRALAAFFVVIHHSWLIAMGGYPGNNGPWFTDWMIYGHLAVSVFIVVSGFSLALSPARHGLCLRDGGRGFLRRRFWRIVPPYWAALTIAALLIGTELYSPDNSGAFGTRDFLVHALLLQDAVGNTSPNGAFWSIAVEWHIYFLFPLILLGFRRYGIKVVLPATAALVVGQHILGQLVPAIGTLDRFTPAYLLLFVAGATAAWLSERREGRRAATLLSVFLTAGVGAFVLFSGSENAVRNYFWLDLAVGAATAGLFIAVSQGRFRWLRSMLSLTPLASLGSFAFSLYLIHAPVLVMLNDWVVRPLGLGRMESLILLLAVGSVSSVGAAYVFFLMFERPFLTIRSYRELVAYVRTAALAAVPGRRNFRRRRRSTKNMPAPATVQVEVTEP